MIKKYCQKARMTICMYAYILWCTKFCNQRNPKLQMRMLFDCFIDFLVLGV